MFSVTADENKKQRFRQRIQEYMGRAEKLKGYIEKEKESEFNKRSSIFS